jgi:hypothetical protein
MKSIRERPIIMGADSVRAILDGRKTQTRRVVNSRIFIEIDNGNDPPIFQDSPNFGEALMKYGRYPYGYIGDRLWVKEIWKPGAWRNDGRVAIDYMASPELTHTPWIHMGDQTDNYIPRWLNEISEIGIIPNHDGRYEWEPGKSPFKWKRAMYMPQFASRITLEITDIRVERLQDITGEDALKEGFCNYGTDVDTLDAFCEAWQKLNAKRGYPWESNPWVWVISFKKVSE